MAVQIWNQGRVVGYSAYEIYVKQHIAEHPDEPVATEKEWLASSLGMGSSMLLTMPQIVNNGESEPYFYLDIPLPENSVLAAANTIVASLFIGDVEEKYQVECTINNKENDSSGYILSGGSWGGRVTDYGPTICNTDQGHPRGGYLGPDANIEFDGEFGSFKPSTTPIRQTVLDYARIVDGVIIQPGTWRSSGYSDPAMDFSPELYDHKEGNVTTPSYPRIRLMIKGSESMSTRPKILFTGFTIRSVLAGTTDETGSTNTRHSENGDYLGPAVFPWANKIIFSVPSAYLAIAESEYTRQLSYLYLGAAATLIGDTNPISVRNDSLIDMSSDSGDGILPAPVLESYYSGEQGAENDVKLFPGSTTSNVYRWKKNARVNNDVSDFFTVKDGSCILTVYERDSAYPPALYGTKITEEGENYLYPIDTVAPGSVKMFHGASAEDLSAYQSRFPGTNAVNINENNTIEIYDTESGEKVSTSGKIVNKRVYLGKFIKMNPLYSFPIEDVYVYKKPDTASNLISEDAKLDPDEKYEVVYFKNTENEETNIPNTQKGLWAYIEYQGTRGWVKVNRRNFLGISTTEISNEGHQSPTIDGRTIPIDAVKIWDSVFYKPAGHSNYQEFVWNGEKWSQGGEENFEYYGHVSVWYRVAKLLTYRRTYIEGGHTQDNMWYVVNPDKLSSFQSLSNVNLIKLPPNISQSGDLYCVESTSQGSCDLLTGVSAISRLTSLSVIGNHNAGDWGLFTTDEGLPIDISGTISVIELPPDAKYCSQLGGTANTVSYLYVNVRSTRTIEYEGNTYIDLSNALAPVTGGYILVESDKAYKIHQKSFWWWPCTGSYTHGRVTSTNIDKVTVDGKTSYNIKISGSSSENQLTVGYPYELNTLSSQGTTVTQQELYVLPLDDPYRGGNNLTWDLLLYALGNDKAIDILQSRLKSIQKTLIRSRSAGVGPYIEFGTLSNPIRLYISNNQPETEDVPIGSIGIGWN